MMKAKLMKSTSFNNVWDAIADSPSESANLQVRAQLMKQIAEFIDTRSWDQREAAKHCGLTQPHFNELLRGQISKFSIDTLIDVTSNLGLAVHIKLQSHQ